MDDDDEYDDDLWWLQFKSHACFVFGVSVLLSGECFCTASKGPIERIIFLQYTLYLAADVPDFHSWKVSDWTSVRFVVFWFGLVFLQGYLRINVEWEEVWCSSSEWNLHRVLME